MATLVDLEGLKISTTDKPGEWLTEMANNTKVYSLNGHIHRDNAPAMTTDDQQTWVQHGRMHRSDGPAHLIKSTLTAHWWMEGKHVTSSTLPAETFNKYWIK